MILITRLLARAVRGFAHLYGWEWCVFSLGWRYHLSYSAPHSTTRPWIGISDGQSHHIPLTMIRLDAVFMLWIHHAGARSQAVRTCVAANWSFIIMICNLQATYMSSYIPWLRKKLKEASYFVSTGFHDPVMAQNRAIPCHTELPGCRKALSLTSRGTASISE